MNENLYDLLITQLKTVNGLYPLQQENTNIDPAGKAFSRATLIRTRPSTLSKGVTGRDKHDGFMQVDLYTLLGTGTSAVNALADAVISKFPRGLTLSENDLQVHILRAYRETGGRLSEKYHTVPVIVEWSFATANH